MLSKLLLAVSDGNGDAAADSLASLGSPRDEFDRDVFRRLVGDLVQRSVEMGSDLEAGHVVLEMTRIASQCGMRPPPEFALVRQALLNLDQVASNLDPKFAPAEALSRDVTAVMQARMTGSAGGLLSAAMDARDFTVQLPGRINKVMDSVADGKFELKIDALDGRVYCRDAATCQRADHPACFLASLVVGAALMMRIPTESRIWGYTSIAMICFAVAAAGAIVLVISIIMADRRIALTARRERKTK